MVKIITEQQEIVLDRQAQEVIYSLVKSRKDKGICQKIDHIFIPTLGAVLFGLSITKDYFTTCPYWVGGIIGGLLFIILEIWWWYRDEKRDKRDLFGEDSK